MNRTARLFLFALALLGILVLGALVVVLVLQRQQAAPLPTVAVLPTEPPTLTPSVTPLPSRTPSATPSPLPSHTPTAHPTTTPTATPTIPTRQAPSATPTPTYRSSLAAPLNTPTPTFTPVTPTPTDTLTPTNTVTSSATLTATPGEPVTPVPSATFAVPVLDEDSCISVVGDSVAAGEAVFEIPGTGFATVRSKPFSEALAEQLGAQGLAVGPIQDRSAGAVALSSPNHEPYADSPAYAALMADKCPYTVILPWVNDLSSGLDPAQAAPAFLAALGELITALKEANPTGAVLVLNYFPGAPAPFALNGHAPGFTEANVGAFNAALAGACDSGAFPPGVRCMDVNPAFATVATAYVVGAMTMTDFNAQLTGVISGEDLLNYYATQTPNGTITGDGVHLSSLGKTLLAFRVIEEMRSWGAFPPAE